MESKDQSLKELQARASGGDWDAALDLTMLLIEEGKIIDNAGLQSDNAPPSYDEQKPLPCLQLLKEKCSEI